MEPDSTARADRLSKPPEATEQISQYIRRMFQDRDGKIWFGTTSDGVCRYDPSAVLTGERPLVYFTTTDGLSGNWVGSIVQEANGELWFATGGGVSRFDGKAFTRYTTRDGLASDQVWCLLLDRSGGLWVGTEEGVSRFDPTAARTAGGKAFTPFPLPAADLREFPYYKYPKQINWMIEDKAGNIWFASNGGGAYRYAPAATPTADVGSLTRLTEKEGLCDNFVETILEDKEGNLWFGTRYGGLCKYDPSVQPAVQAGSPGANGTAFTSFGRAELKGEGVWTLCQTSDGAIWAAVSRIGLCRYDGNVFTCYGEEHGEGIRVVQSLMEDRAGALWVGTSAGVYRWDGARFINWTRTDALGNGV